MEETRGASETGREGALSRSAAGKQPLATSKLTAKLALLALSPGAQRTKTIPQVCNNVRMCVRFFK